jgi:starch synthase
MKVIHVTSELAPIAKVGGIGDVILGFCRASLAVGMDVEVILPLYSKINLDLLPDLQKKRNFSFSYGRETLTCTVFHATYAGIPLTLLDINGRSGPFCRQNIYGEKDDIYRFSMFCLASAKYLEDQLFSVVHLHDWMTAVIPYLLQKNAPNVLSLHNLAYTGITSKATLEGMGISPEPFLFEGSYSLLKGGIEIADSLVAVSPNYAREILSPGIGNGLSEVLRNNKEKLCGILNGIDYDYWNPEFDPCLKLHYTKDQLSNKTLIKQELYDSLSLLSPNKPLVVAIARLVPQKGPELIHAGFSKALKEGCSCLLLADSQDSEARRPFEELKKEYPHQIHLEFEFNEPLSHLAFSASDLTLIPSHFEPCGLTQMIAMRYGSIPIVRATGGLKDSVTQETGFIFNEIDAAELEKCIEQALQLWEHNPQKWHSMQIAGMSQDLSWQTPAKEYKKLYQNLISQFKANAAQ